MKVNQLCELRFLHPVGEVCPFGHTDGVKVFLGISLRKYSAVFPFTHLLIKNMNDFAAINAIYANYALDVYPHYGSDVEATLSAGNDLRHGLIGAGVYASHGYERSHKEGVLNTLKLLKGYLAIS